MCELSQVIGDFRVLPEECVLDIVRERALV